MSELTGRSNNSDFVHVRLTAAGLDLAGGHPVTINGRVSVVLIPGQSTRVARFEWDLMLKHQHTPLGEPMVELEPEAEKETH